MSEFDSPTDEQTESLPYKEKRDEVFSKMFNSTNGTPNYRDDMKEIKSIALDLDKSIPKKSSTFDPYVKFLEEQGLLKEKSKQRYDVNYVNIDSSQRKKGSNLETDDYIQLDKDPISFLRGSPNITIYLKNHGFSKNDLISIRNVKYRQIQISSIIGATCTFELIPYTDVMIIRYYHFLPTLIKINPTNTDPPILIDDYVTYDTSNFEIDISGVLSNNGTKSFDNIPLNMINTTHKVNLINPLDSTTPIDAKTFYVILARKYYPPTGIFIPPPKYPIKIIYHYIAGIPVSLINADYPVTLNNYTGYHVIKSTTTNTFTITMPINSTGMPIINGITVEFTPTNLPPYYPFLYTLTNLPPDGLLDDDISGGESGIMIAKVNNFDYGYGNPNKYRIDLGFTYTNVILAKLISTEIPDPKKNVYKISSNIQNNKLYWENISDGPYLYSLELEPGNYRTNNDLARALENAFYNTPRINYVIDSNVPDGSLHISRYSNHNIMNITIDESTNISTFSSVIETESPLGILSVTPILDLLLHPTGQYTLTIQHLKNGLDVGTIIMLKDVINTNGISLIDLNQSFAITAIITVDTYEIVTPKINLISDVTVTNGGYMMKILSPNEFRLHFEFPDTMGILLGFSNVGKEFAVTKFDSTIKSTDPYVYDTPLAPELFSEAVTNVTDDPDYILMKCHQLGRTTVFGKISDVFTKIQLLRDNSNNGMLYNTFINMPIIFTEPLSQLHDLDISFVYADDTLVEFDSRDHSFTLEIVTLNEFPEKTLIASKTSI